MGSTPSKRPNSAGPPTRGQIARSFDEIARSFDETRADPWQEVVTFAGALPPGSKVIDLGCGNGRHTQVLLESRHRAIAFDASRRLLDSARRRARNADIVLGDLCALPFGSASFDAAIAVASLHHLPTAADRLVALREIARILRPRGRALLMAWAFEQPRFQETMALRKDRRGPGVGDVWVPWRAGGKDVNRFYHLFEDGELPRLALDADLRVERYFRSGDNYAVVAERNG